MDLYALGLLACLWLVTLGLIRAIDKMGSDT